MTGLRHHVVVEVGDPDHRVVAGVAANAGPNHGAVRVTK
jgi:hypothetical protein